MRQTILLVDDDPARLNLLARLIKQAGFRTITARIGPSGVSFPEHEQPVLVLLDYGSGSERNARDIAALIRLQYGSTRLVLLSSRSSLPPEMAGLVDEFAHGMATKVCCLP